MNTELLLSALLKAGDEPTCIQQMRKIIVALAASGKLDKSHWRRTDEHPRMSAEVLPVGFDDPSAFAPLGAVARIEKGKTGIKQAQPGKFAMVVTAANRITCDHYDFEGAAAIVPLVSSTGHGKASLHRLHYQEGRFALGTILAAIFPKNPKLISARFIFEYLSAFKEELLVSRMIGTANVSLSVGKIAEVPVPLICPEVQSRVDELMELCDRLEAARRDREIKRDRLAAASFARLSAPKPDIFQNDVRFSLDALPAMTARPDQIRLLRQTIISLAVRGKLVPQDKNDEPARELLERIATERAELVKHRLIRREEPLDLIQSIRQPFDIPENWTWARIGETVLFTQYGTSQKAHVSENGVPVLTMGNIQEGAVNWGKDKRISESSKDLPALFLRRFDLLYNRTNSAELVGKTGIYLGEDGLRTFASYLIRLRPSVNWTNPVFLNLAMNTPEFRMTQIVPLIKKQTGQANVSGTALKNMLIPLPPLAEQNRIVAKVDELMALCDQLEASLITEQSDRSRLLDALLHKALRPAVAKEDQRIRDKWRARSAISSYVVSRLSSKRSFGRTAHMKHLYLAEAHLGLELDGTYAREAAGPLDVRIYDLEKQATSSGWYSPRVEVLTSGQEKVTYSSGKDIEQIVEEGTSFLGSSRAELDRVLGLMGDMSTEEVEIIATLFAVWNDALIDAESPDDDWIVKEVREHWHKSKQRFTPTQLKKWIGWMRANDLVPIGKLPRTIQQITLDF